MDKDTIEITKEIEEIIDAENHIKELLATKRLEELQYYINGELSQKYLVEKAVHNMIYTEQPTSVEQNAANALAFLGELKAQKLIKIGMKYIESKEINRNG